MTTLVGADVEELHDLARACAAGAHELRDLGGHLTRSIEAAEGWQGPDAERCKEEWALFAQARMVGVSEALEAAGRLLADNADEQERASGVETLAADEGFGVLRTLAGAWPLADLLRRGAGVWDKAKHLAAFLRAMTLPASGFVALTRFEKLRDALEFFRNGDGKGLWNRVGLGGVGRVLGRLSLPITALTGAWDVITAGGYDGARGWAARGFGLAGAGGALALIAGGAGVITLGTVGAAVAAVGVVGYGLWTLGNYAYDHRSAIGGFLGRVWHSTATAAADGWREVQDAKSWAFRRLTVPPHPALRETSSP